MPVKEAEAANSLIDQGVDVLTCHVDSPKVIIETAERRGISLHRLPRQPGGAGAQRLPDRRRVELGEGLHRLRNDDQNGQEIPEPPPRRPQGGQIVKMSPYGKDVSDEAKKKADAVKAKFMDGTFVIFKGPIKDNTGKEVIPAGKSYGNGRRAGKHELSRGGRRGRVRMA